MKAITIQGAGIDRTNIIDDTSTAGGDEPFLIRSVKGKPFRITGITFKGWDGKHYRNSGSWSVISIEGHCKNWRIDHCRFLNLHKVIQISGAATGLIDHRMFEPSTPRNQLTSSWSVSLRDRKEAPSSRWALAEDKACLVDSRMVRTPLTVSSEWAPRSAAAVCDSQATTNAAE